MPSLHLEIVGATATEPWYNLRRRFIRADSGMTRLFPSLTGTAQLRFYKRESLLLKMPRHGDYERDREEGNGKKLELKMGRI